MDKRGKNKENKKPVRSMSITDAFRVKKCLFDPIKLDFTSPKPGPTVAASSPSPSPNDSPYALFRIRKRKSQGSFQKFSDGTDDGTPLKRSQSMKRPNDNMTMDDVVMDSPVNSSSVKLAVQKAMTVPNLIGDFSKPCILPTIEGKHQDLKCISPQTVANLLGGREYLTYKIIDCRYPYEFQGGHIKNAVNMYNKGEAERDFFNSSVTATKQGINDVLIFYCEFSSERAPGMLRYLRSKDRDLNKDCYPFLFYPELYLVEGGYKAFYSSFMELCQPQEYKTMLDKDCSKDLTLYRSQCKSWSMKSKRDKRAKTLKF